MRPTLTYEELEKKYRDPREDLAIGEDAWLEKLNAGELETPHRIPDFSRFLESKGIKEDDARVPLLKEVWNEAIFSACELFEYREGVDHGVSKAFTVD